MAKKYDFSFGAIAEKMGLVEPQFVDVCLLIQSQDRRAGHQIRPLGEIMIERGFLTPNQVEMILSQQKKSAGARHLGPYCLLEKLGEGGMGKVYKARVRATGALVAIKVLSRKYAEDRDYVRRFKREAAVGMELNHPHIVRILTVGSDKGIRYMSMELVEGGDLKGLLKEEGKLPERKALKITYKIAHALACAHKLGIVHRDVKPSNIMFNISGEVKLSDFGLVKTLAKQTVQLTQAGVAVGTPHYISPEQARGSQDVDIRADIYSLGVTLYHAVTGQRPFTGANGLEIMTKVVKGRYRPANEVNPALSFGCLKIIDRMMEHDRDLRYDSPKKLILHLEKVLGIKRPQR